MSKMRRVRVLIKGKVHSVFFRANIKKLANELGLKGYVKNVPEGVEAVFEGENEKVKDMLEFCAIGPEAAKVTTIEVTEEKYLAQYKEFTIEY